MQSETTMTTNPRAAGIRCLLAGVLGFALFAPSTQAAAQTTLDRVVATVNGELVTKSDVLWNVALDPDAAPSEFWSVEVQALTLRSIIDQRLLLQEAAKLSATGVTDQEIAEEVARLSSRFARPDDPNRFTERLRLVGLTQERLRRIARDRLRIAKFVEFRFGSFVLVTEDEILQVYRTERVPRLRQHGVVPPAEPSAEERESIRKALTDEKVNQAIDEYLEGARARAEIVMLGEGDSRKETVGRRQETGDRRQETGDSRKEIGDRR